MATREAEPQARTQVGHVFVLHSDLSKLAADAWMLPTDDKFTIEETWHVSGVIPQMPAKPADWHNDGMRVLRVPDWPAHLSPPWLVNVGGIRIPSCDMCRQRAATTFCETDNANFCQACDADTHRNPRLPVLQLHRVGRGAYLSPACWVLLVLFHFLYYYYFLLVFSLLQLIF